MMALSQEDYMRAVVGDDQQLWKAMAGFFTPGTPLYTEEGGEILKGPRDLDAARSSCCRKPATTASRSPASWRRTSHHQGAWARSPPTC